MTRTPRDRKVADLHHVVNRGARRLPTFADDDDRRAFIGILGDALLEHGATCAALCLMGNHYHLMISADIHALGKVMHAVGSKYTRRFNHRHRFDGPLFKERYYNSPIREDAYLVRCLRYIYRNPAVLTHRPDLARHPWSTFRHHLGLSPSPAWFDPKIGLRAFDDDRSAMRRFVLDDSGSVPTPLEIWGWLEHRGIPKDLARQLAVVVSTETGWSDDQVGRDLGIASRGSVRYARSKGRKELASGGDLDRLVRSCRIDLRLAPGVANFGPSWLVEAESEGPADTGG